jgi:hypothetical protein
MKKLTSLLTVGVLAGASQNAMAADLTIAVQNLTQGIYFTPVLAIAHSPDNSLFEVGVAAIPELQEMAEGGSLAGLATIGDAISANYANVDGLTVPGATNSIMLTNADGNSVLSIVGMILPSNDGFIGLDNWTIPTEAGTYTIYLNAYDAGTEANDEIRGSGASGMAGMPVPPPLEPILGTGGAGVTTTETNATVHIHRGSIGDDSADGGQSDIVNSVHRWLNPVAKVTVTVN